MDKRLNGLKLKTLLSAFVDLILPRECVVCGCSLAPDEEHICLSCLCDLPRTYFENASRNAMSEKLNSLILPEEYEPYAYAAALYYYSSGYDNISKALKYKRNFGEGKFFAHMLGEKLLSSPLFRTVDLIVPVPLHFLRRFARGYNQAEVIAREVSIRLSAPVDKRILKRVRCTKSQALISSEEKAQNTLGAFSATKHGKDRIAAHGAQHILIVDDVFTSGSTTAECYKALRSIVGKDVRISVACLAYASS